MHSSEARWTISLVESNLVRGRFCFLCKTPILLEDMTAVTITFQEDSLYFHDQDGPLGAPACFDQFLGGLTRFHELQPQYRLERSSQVIN